MFRSYLKFVNKLVAGLPTCGSNQEMKQVSVPENQLGEPTSPAGFACTSNESRGATSSLTT